MSLPQSFIRRDPPQEIEKRDDIILSYIDDQVKFLKLKYPDKSEDELTEIVKKIVKDKIKRPRAKVIYYPTFGDAVMKIEDLLNITRKYNDKFISPCGTFFESPNIKVGNSILFINDCNENRDKYKKLMFVLKEDGKIQEADNADSIQNLAKILTNALTGNHSFLGSPFYDLESYNGITSVCRNGTVMCYATVEMLLIGNYSFPNKEKVIEYILNSANYTPNIEKTKAIIEKYPWFYVPETEDIVKELTGTMFYYSSKKHIEETRAFITDLLDRLTPEQKTYVFYRRNFHNLLKYNDAYFRKYIEELFKIDENLEPTDEIEKIPNDVAMMMAVIFDKTLEGKTFGAKLIKENPEIAKRYSALAKLVLDHILKINDIYDAFLYSGEFLADIPNRQKMIRKVVPNSDTDSILYTVYNQVSWWTHGDLRVTQSSISMAAFTMWIIGNVLDAANYDMAIVRGCIKENTRELYTKYEFLYPVYCKTNLGKHYFGLQAYREGHKQDPPELDVKGVAFQTSNIPDVSRKFSKDFLRLILNSFARNGSTDIEELILHCLDYEKQIIDSLINGELTYYGNTAIKGKDEYKDYVKSIYFNYLMWEEVFSETYGNIRLPGKFTLVPIKEKAFKTDSYLRYIETYDKVSYEKLIKYLENIKKKYPTKKITRMPLPITLTRMPKILLPAVDIRKIVYKNMAPSQLALEQIGMYLGDAKKMPLLHDYYSDLAVDNIKLD